MAGPARVDRVVGEIITECQRGLDLARLQSEVVTRLKRVVSIDAAFVATADPATLLFTGAVSDAPLGSVADLFLANEFGQDDVNKFRHLSRAPSRVASLDESTAGDRPSSARFREIMAPLGLGDELRGAFVSGAATWGYFCFHRAASAYGFSEAERRLVARVLSPIADGLRTGLLLAEAQTAGGEPGVVVLAADLSLISATSAGEAALAELGHRRDRDPLPVPVLAVGRALLAPPGQAAPVVSARARVRAASGRWFTVHAARMTGEGPACVAVVLEPSAPSDLSPLRILAYGLTPRETDVVHAVLRGEPAKRIARQLRISEYTVNDHLKSVYDKVGVRSRAELMASVFGDLQAAAING